jgi:hypothetical protein
MALFPAIPLASSTMAGLTCDSPRQCPRRHCVVHGATAVVEPVCGHPKVYEELEARTRPRGTSTVLRLSPLIFNSAWSMQAHSDPFGLPNFPGLTLATAAPPAALSRRSETRSTRSTAPRTPLSGCSGVPLRCRLPAGRPRRPLRPGGAESLPSRRTLGWRQPRSTPGRRGCCGSTSPARSADGLSCRICRISSPRVPPSRWTRC